MIFGTTESRALRSGPFRSREIGTVPRRFPQKKIHEGCPFRVFQNDYLVNKAISRGSGGTMKYLCSVFFDEKNLDGLSESALQTLDDESLAFDQTLRERGHLIAAQALQPVSAATTVRLRNGKVSITDGPFAETNEQIGGFLLIEAKDLNEAIQIASNIPVIRLGGIEVRPIKELVASKTVK
jgi:hypothetical protein